MHAANRIAVERSVDAVKDGAERATREASPWIERLGRFGYAAKGVVYLVIGVLAVQAALGKGGGTTDQRGALAQIAAAPFGRILLVLLTIGLLGYAVWRFVQAAKDTEGKGSEPKGLLARAGYAGVGVLYLGLAFSALRLLLGSGGSSGQQQAQDWTARLLGQPMGAWLVGLAGMAVIANGMSQLYRAYSAKFREKLRTSEMELRQVDWVTKVGRAGYAARGVAFGLIGLFLIQAARHGEPGEVRGLDGALAALAEQPSGPEMLGLVAAGLAAYGIFALVEARYRRMVLR
jgi:Na+/proline symporter